MLSWISFDASAYYLKSAQWHSSAGSYTSWKKKYQLPKSARKEEKNNSCPFCMPDNVIRKKNLLISNNDNPIPSVGCTLLPGIIKISKKY